MATERDATTKYAPYRDAFVPTPMASASMAVAAHVAESTFARHMTDASIDFEFLVLGDALTEATTGWWQYMHWRFPRAMGMATYAAPAPPRPVYIDAIRWGTYAGENASVSPRFSVVIAHADALPPTLSLLEGGVLVALDAAVHDASLLAQAFDQVDVFPSGIVVAHDYKPRDAAGSLAEALAPHPAAEEDWQVPAAIPAVYWAQVISRGGDRSQ